MKAFWVVSVVTEQIRPCLGERTKNLSSSPLGSSFHMRVDSIHPSGYMTEVVDFIQPKRNCVLRYICQLWQAGDTEKSLWLCEIEDMAELWRLQEAHILSMQHSWRISLCTGYKLDTDLVWLYHHLNNRDWVETFPRNFQFPTNCHWNRMWHSME